MHEKYRILELIVEAYQILVTLAYHLMDYDYVHWAFVEMFIDYLEELKRQILDEVLEGGDR